MNENITIIYERLVLIKKWPYWISWLLTGFIFFMAEEIMARVMNDTRFFWTKLLFCVMIFMLPSTAIWMKHNFQCTIPHLFSLLWTDEQELEEWLTERTRRIFSLTSWPARIVTLGIIVAASLTVVFIGLPYNSLWKNLTTLGGFIILLFMCGQGAYALIDTLITLREIGQRPINTPFYKLPHPGITHLQNYYFSTALLYTLDFIVLLIAVWQGPYGINKEMLFWVIFIGFFPLTLFIWTFFQIHQLMKRVKEKIYEMVNVEVQNIFLKLDNHSSVKKIEKLQKWMDIQEKVLKLREWPIDFQSVFTFSLALATAIIQSTVSFFQLTTP